MYEPQRVKRHMNMTNSGAERARIVHKNDKKRKGNLWKKHAKRRDKKAKERRKKGIKHPGARI